MYICSLALCNMLMQPSFNGIGNSDWNGELGNDFELYKQVCLPLNEECKSEKEPRMIQPGVLSSPTS